ncbi:unnamed protein product [Sphagnum jensenii]|uniref:Uncharacterized protein n=1 Tax=Sphagnum jensenii TaxID=128206 RepID=A0ABP1BKD2_9BRYO
MELRYSSSAASMEFHSALQQLTLRSVESRCSAVASHVSQCVAALQHRNVELRYSSAAAPELGAALQHCSKLRSLELAAPLLQAPKLTL